MALGTPSVFLAQFLFNKCSVVQGVRQWIKSGPTSERKKHQNKMQTEGEAVKAQVITDQDKNTTEFLALQLLEPSVSEDEQDEYQG